MLTVATLLWRANRTSLSFSTMYDETWVEKLFRGFARNLMQPFRFVCYTDRERAFAEPIEQRQIRSAEPSYADCVQPFELNEPMILCGLDTIVTGNIDHLAAYCFEADTLALPRDPYQPERACNGVCLVPAGHAYVFDAWDGENDMIWMRQQEHVFIDDLFPGQVQSYKGAVLRKGLGDSRIVYFHGEAKPHQLDARWVAEHWR